MSAITSTTVETLDKDCLWAVTIKRTDGSETLYGICKRVDGSYVTRLQGDRLGQFDTFDDALASLLVGSDDRLESKFWAELKDLAREMAAVHETKCAALVVNSDNTITLRAYNAYGWALRWAIKQRNVGAKHVLVYENMHGDHRFVAKSHDSLYWFSL